MINPELTARRLLEYYTANRGVGHTHTAMEGVLINEGARILTAHTAHGEQIQEGYDLPRGTAVSLHRLTNRGMQGTRGPLVLDHYAVETLLLGLLTEIGVERKRAVDLERKVDRIKWIANE